MKDYTPHEVARFFRELHDDDLGVELRAAIPKLPPNDQRLIMGYAKGLSPQEAANEMGMENKNGQRWFSKLVRDLARKASGK